MRLAFVGYRDFGDKVRFEVLNFTPSVEVFYNFCNKIDATGGKDTPEDVFGGLKEAIALNWTKGLFFARSEAIFWCSIELCSEYFEKHTVQKIFFCQ